MTSDSMNLSPPIEGVLERIIRANDIPPRPLIIDRIRAAMRKDSPNYNYVGQLIKSDKP